jgi:hypothetical protein
LEFEYVELSHQEVLELSIGDTMSSHPVNQGSTREELWAKVLRQREHIVDVEVEMDKRVSRLTIELNHAKDRYDVVFGKLKTVRKILNTEA